jgi:hypothetical protein
MERRVCRFFQQGNCRNGTNCNFLHDNENNPPRGMGIVGFPQMGTKMADDIITQKIYEKNENESGSKICKFFLEGNCKHQICYSIHAYSQHLDHVIFDEDFHSNTIIGMCQISK